MKSIAIFVSGEGTNAAAIIDYFRGSEVARVCIVVCNRKDAGAHRLLADKGVPIVDITQATLSDKDNMTRLLQGVDYIVLAGFLAFIPDWLTERYEGRILNIHPSLLPRHGGRGMYGLRVHEAVLESGDRESGITIHLVNNKYDSGEILFQTRCPVLPDDTAETLAQRVHELEHMYYPQIIEQSIKNEADS